MPGPPMTSYVPPKINTELVLYVGLVSQADTKTFQANPTIAAGDFKVSIDGGSLANLTTLPVVTPTGGKLVKITLSDVEMSGSNIMVVCSDAAGAEWCDLVLLLNTADYQINDIGSDTEQILLVTGIDGVVVASGSKTGYSLASTGLDAITATAPGGVATTFPQMVVQLWRRFFKKADKSPTEIKTYADNGTSVLTTQTISDDGAGNEEQGAAS